MRMPAVASVGRVATLIAVMAGAGAAPAANRQTPGGPATTTDADRAAAPLPADSGLFAPVARQWAARRSEVERLSKRGPSPRLVGLLLAGGRPDAAADALQELRGDDRDVALAQARVHLARLDFAAAAPALEAIMARPDPTDAEREACYAWWSAHDDAAQIDAATRTVIGSGAARAPDWNAAGRLAHDLLDEARAESCFTRALEHSTSVATSGDSAVAEASAQQVRALSGLGRVAFKRRDYDGALVHHLRAIERGATADVLMGLAETMIRLGRTDEAISAAEWAVTLDPYDETGHYYLGNGYARRSYTQLATAYPGAFADAAGRTALARADHLLAAGDRPGARAAYDAIRAAHPAWADAQVRVASLDFEDARFDDARDRCFEALAACSEYGRAHATLAKALESQRFSVDVHRAGYELQFETMAVPDVPGIDRFVVNWQSLSPRHRKRVALSIAPWRRFLPVLIAGGADYYIKPLYMLLSETPGQATLRDQRINYDSRLWDDVRGAGGYHTVTGIEDVERTIFDRYNTVLHELTHQVHAVLTADQRRAIQDLYAHAKVRDDSTRDGFLSRYAGGSVFEYFAEGANALESPKRDAFDPREVVRERLVVMDPDLQSIVERFMAIEDVSASYPVAYSNAGDDVLERGHVDEALTWYEKALARAPNEETALLSSLRALMLGNRGRAIVTAAEGARAAHPASGDVVSLAGQALWHGGRGLDAAIASLRSGRLAVPADDRHEVDLSLARLEWIAGNATSALASSDSVLAYQSDHPTGLWRRAAALALAERWDEAFIFYDQAVRLRTGVVELRCDYARDLVRAGRVDEADGQLAEARLLDAENPTAEALRGWAALIAGDRGAARAHLEQALAWGPWCDLATILLARLERLDGNPRAADRALDPVRKRVAKRLAPEYVYRTALASWEPVHELPAVERALLDGVGAP